MDHSMSGPEGPGQGVAALDQAVWKAHNDVRANPTSFVPPLEAML